MNGSRNMAKTDILSLEKILKDSRSDLLTGSYDIRPASFLPYKDYSGGQTTSYAAAAMAQQQLEERIQASLFKKIRREIEESIANAMTVPQSILQGSTNTNMNSALYGNPTAPIKPTAPVTQIQSVYPITNIAFTQMYDVEKLLAVLNITIAYPHLEREIRELAETALGGGTEVFVAKLRRARHHKDAPVTVDLPEWVVDGHTYDPWYRDISESSARYATLAERSYAAQVGANHTKHIMVWLFETTIEGIKIRVLIHDLLDMGYTNTVRSNRYEKAIHPFAVKTDTEYNLVT